MTGILYSTVTNVQYLDNIGMQFNFTGTPTGSFTAQISADYEQDQYGNVTDAGNWVSMSPALGTAAGTADSIAGDINQTGFAWMRAKYTPTGAGVQTIQPVADSSGSLAGKYFLLQSANGTTKYAIWFKVSGSGSAPVVSGYTSTEVDISTGDTAASVGTAMATVIAALGGAAVFSATGTTTVTVTNLVSGPFVAIVDVDSGFTFAVTAGAGVLNAFITGKML